MKNFYQDNDDIQFLFENLDWPRTVPLHELDFEDKALYDYAPEDLDDAVDNYRRVLNVVGEIAAEYSAPRSEQVDLEGTSFKGGEVSYAKGISDSLNLLAKSDLMGMTLPRKYGGLNFPATVFAMSNEIIARADASLQNLFGLQGIGELINVFASEELKDKYLPLFSQGKVTGAMALTESEAGSDLQSVKLKAIQDQGGTWHLDGVKRFITNGNADILLVLARSDFDEEGGLGLSLFLCEGKDGVKVRRIEDKLGIHGSPTCELQFDSVPAFLIGERRRGLVTYVLALLNGARIGTAAQSIGISQAALNEAKAFAHSRYQYGRRIETIPAVAEMLTEMQLQIEAARALTYEASFTMDIAAGILNKIHCLQKAEAKPDVSMIKELKKEAKKYERLVIFLTPIAKYYSTEMSNRVTSDAIQILGGSGYMKDYPVERHYRDARITNIYEGTSQLQIAATTRGIVSGAAERHFNERAKDKSIASMKGLSKKLLQARRWLDEAIKYLNKKKDARYTDLYARNLVDMATGILIGYLFIKQAQNSNRKKIIAKRFITRLLPQIKMNYHHITSDDKSTLKHFDTLVPLHTE
ncbi:MAG: acyl-CoA dehydrogenase family protein [Deltaproteobacteria bacterium]|nr:acyl-CoA dehydrogenase family protein [Deltaproteobacteria bacterium]